MLSTLMSARSVTAVLSRVPLHLAVRSPARLFVLSAVPASTTATPHIISSSTTTTATTTATAIATASPLRRIPRRSFGIFDKLKGKVSGHYEKAKALKTAKNQEDMWQMQVSAYVRATNKEEGGAGVFNMGSYIDMMKAMYKKGGVTGWKSKMPGMSRMLGEEAETLKKMAKLVGEFTEEERQLTSEAGISAARRAELSEKTGIDLKVVNQFLDQSMTHFAMSALVNRRVEQAKPLPADALEAHDMMAVDQKYMPGYLKAFFKRKTMESLEVEDQRPSNEWRPHGKAKTKGGRTAAALKNRKKRKR